MNLSSISQRIHDLCAVFLIVPLGSSVILSWNPNSEPDLMGYRIYYGTAPRTYDKVLNVGKVTRYEIRQFDHEGRYFFAVTAYDSSGNESDFSEEVSAVIQKETGADSSQTADARTAIYNFPNPFKPEIEVTHFRYYLTEAGKVSIQIFNVSNERVKTVISSAQKAAGEHTEDTWDGKDEKGQALANGVYFAMIKINQASHLVKIVIAR
ncbi:MAG: T9SS C-terminal target domain-containing protein [Calditrichaeota bacterium]|nr:MAG: T9SS C-terminal target domain-containing protein [Calditrichota bacterium]